MSKLKALEADLKQGRISRSNERFNKLLVQGRAELDDAKRREIYREM